MDVIIVCSLAAWTLRCRIAQGGNLWVDRFMPFPCQYDAY
jgi:hypothetical protein